MGLWSRLVSVITGHKSGEAAPAVSYEPDLSAPPPPAPAPPVERPPIFDEEDVHAVKAVEVLKQCFDPEIPVNIFDLGLIYEVKAGADAVQIQMTFTSKNCPAAQAIPDDVRKKLNGQLGIAEDAVDIDVVFEPVWSPAMISEAGREILGIGA